MHETRLDVVFGAARVYTVTVPGPKWKSWFEVGYAWGCDVPTILCVKHKKNWEKVLEFDVRDQRCLPYKKISDLKKSLTKELKTLQDDKVI